MSNSNGAVPLSALDLLGLAEQKRVARVDLADAGYSGILYVCDLSTSQMQQIVVTPRRGKKIKRYEKEESIEFDMSDLATEAGSKFLEACLVTDSEGGAILARAFEAGIDDEGNEPDYITFPLTELVFMFSQMAAELKGAHKAREKLESLGSGITDLIVKKVREISGTAEDRVAEKKENS